MLEVEITPLESVIPSVPAAEVAAVESELVVPEVSVKDVIAYVGAVVYPVEVRCGERARSRRSQPVIRDMQCHADGEVECALNTEVIGSRDDS